MNSNSSMQTEIQSLRQQLQQKETELQKKSQLLQMFEQRMPEVNTIIERNTVQKRQYVQALHKYLVQLEQVNRRQRRVWINE